MSFSFMNHLSKVDKLGEEFGLFSQDLPEKMLKIHTYNKVNPSSKIQIQFTWGMQVFTCDQIDKSGITHNASSIFNFFVFLHYWN